MHDQDTYAAGSVGHARAAAENIVAIPGHTAHTALLLAEQAVSNILTQLQNAEQERNELFRQLGAKQELVDFLTNERERLSRHARELLVPNKGS